MNTTTDNTMTAFIPDTISYKLHLIKMKGRPLMPSIRTLWLTRTG